LTIYGTTPQAHPRDGVWARNHAATITVNTTDDELSTDGDCSLREAIQAANVDAAVDACPAGIGSDTIDVPAGIQVLDRPLDRGRAV